MKKAFLSVAAAFAVLVPSALLAGTMSDYCSTPPYVTRTVPPNIMILMDNSQDMLGPAYPGSYDATKTYTGYFKENASYRYSSNKFIEDPSGTYGGNFLNWATMSKFDFVQKILIGGNSASKQGNAHTLVSISGNWGSRDAGPGCSVTVNSANLTISGNSCALNEGESPCPTPATDPGSFPQSEGSGRDGRAPSITSPTGSTLPRVVKGQCYTFEFQAKWGKTDASGAALYEWSSSGTLPAGLTLHKDSGILYGVPTAVETRTFSVTVKDKSIPALIDTKTVTVSVEEATVSEKRMTVKVQLVEEPLVDLNGNDIWDPGENFTDTNGNGVWDGKQGIFQKFWDAQNPRARWGLSMFSQQGATTSVDIDACIPAHPASSFYTRIQNATPNAASPLAKGLFGDINYYGFKPPYNANSYRGCSNADPIDSVTCRKNFILVLTSGSNVTGDVFASTGECSQADPLVRNACYAFKTDLRPDHPGKQNVKTFIVNTMGINDTILRAAAEAGGGNYYPAEDPSELEGALLKALNDILDQASSGTAVSVLTTSSRGTGSMVQAYFLPVKQEGTREITWTGYAQNIWIDPQDNLREDSVNDFGLRQDQDKVVKIYYDQSVNETKAALFTTLADGTGGSLQACSNPEIKAFADVSYLWEAGNRLAKKNPGTRDIFTSKKVRRGNQEIQDFSNNAFTVSNVTGNAILSDALNPDDRYSSENIVRYVRGECLETGVTGDGACSGTVSADYRDRRLSIPGGDANGNVWKLGDIISSTPKVLANTPTNLYHIEYGDSSYYRFLSSPEHQNRTSVAFIGANDGMLHAFRVGYLKDTGLSDGYKAKFEDAKDLGSTSGLGEELWGYIPFNAFPYLKYLANPNYCHIYYNDLSVRLVDASFGCSTSDDCRGADGIRKPESWRTILIGGMRFGGACSGGTPSPPSAVTDVGFSAYYALDVTDPLDPKPLWEFSDPDMGYATTFPSIVRTGSRNTNGNWYVVFGSGSTTLPKNQTDIGRSTPGYLFLLDLKTGELVQKIGLDHSAIVGDILAIDADRDYSVEKIYFGTSFNNSGWKGKIGSVTVPNEDLSTWTPQVAYLFNDNFPFTASPDAATDTYGNVWVYAGSGKYFSEVDEDVSGDQIFVGIKDKDVTVPLARSGLTDRSNHTTTGVVNGTDTVCTYDSTNDSFGFKTVVTSISPTSQQPGIPDKGWYILLRNGERVITRPLVIGGLVDFLSYVPSSNLCDYGGKSYLYAVDYLRGVAPVNVAIRADKATDGTSGNVTVAGRVLLGPGAPPTGDAIIIPPPKQGQDELKTKIQIATGVIVETENKPLISVISKVVHWLKKE